ncbi:MAG TPA: peptidoglycan-binding domain-containing protein [Gammaproteobacteria bacterium]|nr:peptidoglycan-binding domain-containing protein [Gammaproteobacteria bacterium]
MIEDRDIQGSRGPAALGSELDGDPFDGGRKRRDAATRRPVLAWLAGFVVLGIALHFLLMLRTGDAPPRPSFLALRAPTFEIERPRAGRDRLLSVAEIRWCLREDARIEVLEQRLATQEPQRLNAMVGEYNRRCTRFRYHDDDLEHARRDIDDARRWIVEEALGETYAPSASGTSTALAAAGYSLLIQDVQELLRAVGHEPGPIDGYYGARTRAAVEAFEKDSGRSPTGAISEALRRELLDRARSAGVAESHLLRATTAERAAIRASCAGATGVGSYNRCVESELVSLAQRRPPPARRITEAERTVINDVCLRAKLRGGEAGFARCVDEQLADLAQLESEPSIAAMTEAERTAVKGRCASTGSFYGPAAFYRCAQERLAEAAQPGGRPLL